MSKNYQGILGPQIGKIGPVVGYRWKGRDVYRGHVKYKKNPRTAAQELVRARFRLISNIARAFSPALNFGYAYLANSLQVSPRNVFTKNNMENITGATPSALQVSFSDLTLADGPITPVFDGNLRFADGTLTMQVGDAGQYGCFDDEYDRVVMVVYNKDKGVTKTAEATRERAAESGVSMTIPDAWNDDKVDVYVFVRTTVTEPTVYAEYSGTVYPGMASVSTYVNEITLS